MRVGGCPAVVAQWQSTGDSSQRCPGLFTFLYFRFITSKFLYYNALCPRSPPSVHVSIATCVCVNTDVHLQHVGDIKEGRMLPGVEGGVDDAEVLVLYWHGPTSKGYHASTMGLMEAMESSSAQLIGALEGFM